MSTTSKLEEAEHKVHTLQTGLLLPVPAEAPREGRRGSVGAASSPDGRVPWATCWLRPGQDPHPQPTPS